MEFAQAVLTSVLVKTANGTTLHCSVLYVQSALVVWSDHEENAK